MSELAKRKVKLNALIDEALCKRLDEYVKEQKKKAGIGRISRNSVTEYALNELLNKVEKKSRKKAS